MEQAVLTPITQALKEGALSRRELKLLMRRSNLPGLLHLATFVAVLLCTGFLVWFSEGSWWVIPAMFLHGVVWVHLFALQHECVHYTAFRTRSLNEVLGNICGFAIMLPNRFFRYEHCDHHTYTQLHGKDPELIELPISLGKYLSFVSSVPFWGYRFLEFGRHILGRFSEAEKKFIPREDRVSVVVEARVMAMAYAAILALSAVFDFWGVLWYWWLPLFIGEPVMRAIRMTEHVGRPNVRDMKVNTRTNLVSRPMRFLCWNMNYHAEHHYASSVPFHALPELHRKLQGYVHVEERGYLGAHIDIVSQIIGRKPRLGTRAVDEA
ncbi:MAG: fatty acid desaturase [Rhodobacteraceae bacterium]|nr:fatty acid desaturase [Paracoccaceae bacterium]